MCSAKVSTTCFNLSAIFECITKVPESTLCFGKKIKKIERASATKRPPVISVSWTEESIASPDRSRDEMIKLTEWRC